MKNQKQKAKKLMKQLAKNFVSKSDPNGSYTGNSADGFLPTQDADDL